MPANKKRDGITPAEKKRRAAQAAKDRNAAAGKKVAHHKKASKPAAHKARAHVPGSNGTECVGLGSVRDLAIQMQNPDMFSKMHETIGVYDLASRGVTKHRIVGKFDAELLLSAAEGFAVAATPHPRGNVIITGAMVSNLTSGSAGDYGRTFVTKGSPGSIAARTLDHEWGDIVSFELNDVSTVPQSAVANIGGAGTFPVQYVGQTPGQSPSYLLRPYRSGNPQNPSGTDGYYFPIPGTPFQSATIGIAGTVLLTNNVTSQYAFSLWASLNPVPSFDTTDTFINCTLNSTNTNFIGLSYTNINLSLYKSFYFTICKSSTAPVCDLISVSLQFTGLALTQSSANSSFGTGGVYLIDNADCIDPDFKQYRCVSMSMLVQNQSDVLNKGGNVAGICGLSSQLLVAGGLQYDSLSKKLAVSTGDLSKGRYQWYEPTSDENWRRWRPKDTFAPAVDDNILVIAGQANSATSVIRVTVITVFEIAVDSRKFGGAPYSSVPCGMTESEATGILFAMLAQCPNGTCNPTHEQWTKWLAGIKSFGTGVLKAAILTGKVGLALAPLLL